MMAKVDSECSADFVGIDGASGNCKNCVSPGTGVSKLCGDKFNSLTMLAEDASVCSKHISNVSCLNVFFRHLYNISLSACRQPFRVDIYTDGDTDMVDMATSNTKQSRGKSLL